MKKIKFMCDLKQYNLYLTNNSEYALIHMGYKKHIKDLKQRARVEIRENRNNNIKSRNTICSYHFISSFLDKSDFKLARLNEKNFMFEEMESE